MDKVYKLKQFLIKNIDSFKLPNNSDRKILVDCIADNCDKGRHQKKAILNLEDDIYSSTCHCYKCGNHISLYKYCKTIGILDKLMDFISEITADSLTDIKRELTEVRVNKTDIKQGIKKDSAIDIFKKQNGLIDINLIDEAKKYALKRTFNNNDLIKDWCADDKYIYIPIKNDNGIVAYIGRKFNNEINCPRYNNKVIDKNAILCYNYNNVRDNYKTDSVYLVEGIFDSIAIDFAMNTACSIALLGKSHYKEIIDKLSNDFSRDTNIYICLDSIQKDNNIYSSTMDIFNCASDFFTNIYIINLDYGDPNEIVSKYGAIELKNQLLNNKYDMLHYRFFGGLM